MNPQTPQPDAQVLALTKAIRQKESGGNYGAVGDNATSTGAYQFQPDTWKQYAKEILGNENAQMSEANQNAVAYGKVKKWKDSGLGPAQIAAAWNAGEVRAKDGSWTTHKGVTKVGGKELAYDTPAYVKAVVDLYKQQSQGQAPTAPKQTFSSAITQIQKDNPELQAETQQHSGTLGTNPNDSLFGKLTDNSITRGLISLVPGAKTLGESLGTAAGAIKAKATDLLTGSKQYENYDLSAPSPLKTAVAGAEVVGSAYGAKGLGGLVSSVGGGSALASEPVTGMLTKYAGKEGIKALSAAEKVEAISTELAKGVGGQQAIFQKALQELAPQVLREAGVGSFAELNPGIAKALGLSWKAVKLLGEIAIGGSVYNAAKGLIKK